MSDFDTADESEMIPTERVALITWLMCTGQEMRTAEIAEIVGATPNGAYRMMVKISRVIPVSQNDGIWQLHSDSLSDSM